jgi:hypothetical protein
MNGFSFEINLSNVSAVLSISEQLENESLKESSLELIRSNISEDYRLCLNLLKSVPTIEISVVENAISNVSKSFQMIPLEDLLDISPPLLSQILRSDFFRISDHNSFFSSCRLIRVIWAGKLRGFL